MSREHRIVTAAGSAAISCLLLLGCGENTYGPPKHEKARGVAAPTGISARGQKTDRAPDDTPREELAFDDPFAADEPTPDALGAAAAPEAADTPSEAEKPRDLSAELVQMLGIPAACLAARPANVAPQSIVIHVTAHVMPSGSVSRGEASASELTGDELACVRGRLESLRFAPPIEDAPLTVTGVLTLAQGAAP